MKDQSFTISGPAGPLEARLSITSDAKWVGIVCHPHPLHGGTMDNKVVTSACKAIQAAGGHSLQFNFRGVGQSAGKYDMGKGEMLDAQAVYDYAALNYPDWPIKLIGFSFGAYIAYHLSFVRPCTQLTLIAPPIGRFEFQDQAPNCPWQIVQGDLDEVVDFKAVLNWQNNLVPAANLDVLPGCSHFFHGQLPLLKTCLQNFLEI